MDPRRWVRSTCRRPREGEEGERWRMRGGPGLSGSPSSSHPCMARAPWSGLVALIGERGTWGGGGWLESSGTTTQCHHRPSLGAAQRRRENGGEGKGNPAGEFTSSEARSGRSFERRWRTIAKDGGATSPWRIRGASGSTVGEVRRAQAWSARAGALGRRK